MYCECRLRMEVRDEHAGRRVRCPRCGKVSRVPVRRQSERFELQAPGETSLELAPSPPGVKSPAGDDPLEQSAVLEPHWSEHDGGVYEDDEDDLHSPDLAALQQAATPHPKADPHPSASEAIARGDTVDIQAKPRSGHWRLLLTAGMSLLAIGLFSSLTWFVILPALNNQQASLRQRLAGVERWVMDSLNEQLETHQPDGPDYDVASFAWYPEGLDRPVPFEGVIVNATRREVGQVKGTYDLKTRRLKATYTYPAGPLDIALTGP